jgi:inhibitor of KinA
MILRQAGDGAMLAEFSETLDPAAVARLRALDAALSADPPEGLIETVPGLRSLLLLHDPLRLSARRLRALLEGMADTLHESPVVGAEWLIPVCYEGEFAADLAEVAARTGFSAEEVVRRHLAVPYTAIAVGSFPGLPYLGGLDPALEMPRRVPPRVLVPQGSVAIALTMSNIYPQATPGGWNILGRTPVPIFDARWAAPSLLSPGDVVRHRAVGRAEFDALAAEFAAGHDPRAECLV